MTVKRSAVSALVPIRDGVNHISNLKKQLEKTLLAQDEIVLIDDGSTDRTWKNLLEWARQDSRILLLKNRDYGLANALNLGLTSASNNLVARFDIDDRYRSDRITKQLQAMSAESVAVFSDYSFRSINYDYLGAIPTAVFPSATSLSLVSSQRTPHPVVLLNRDAVISVGGYRQDDFPAEDLSLWLRLSRVGSLVTSPEELLEYTINPKGVSSTKRQLQLQKKVQLLGSIGINSPDFIYVAENLLEIFKSYESLNQSAIRKLLLFRELQIVASASHRSLTNTKSSLLRTLGLRDFIDIYKFGSSTAHRKFLRSSI